MTALWPTRYLLISYQGNHNGWKVATVHGQTALALVPQVGFEPTTICLEGSRSIL